MNGAFVLWLAMHNTAAVIYSDLKAYDDRMSVSKSHILCIYRDFMGIVED